MSKVLLSFLPKTLEYSLVMKKRSFTSSFVKKKPEENPYPKWMTGVVKRHPDGFGFFIPDDAKHADAYVPQHIMTSIMTLDKVNAYVDKEQRKDRFSIKKIEVTQRQWVKVVGLASELLPSQFKKWGAGWVRIEDREGAWGQDLVVKTGSKDTQAIVKQVIVAEVDSYPGDSNGFKGTLISKLGLMSDASIDIQRVIHGHHLPFEFSKKTIKQAQQYPNEVTEKDIKARKDLRQLPFVTIDGATAKDFDDAVYVTPLKKGGHKLYVAIADVSYYVPAGSPIDEEAYQRGTSSYFPNFVIPMLPEKLSNHLCSLNPKLDRLSLVCELNFDSQGKMESYEFYEAVINSQARLTYGLAQEIMDGQRPHDYLFIVDHLLEAKKLAEKLLALRFENGSLELELAEIQIVVDAQGLPLDIIKVHRIFAHRLIEEFMLAANIAAARLLDKSKVPALYRVHEPPKKESLQTLERFAKTFGHKTFLSDENLQKELTQLIQKLHNSPQSEIFSGLVLRSLKQAKYSHENLGHFGLAFSHYTHFTSPIRRYPDLIVHRLIKSVIKKEKKFPSLDEVTTWGVWLSACEQRAVKAERQIQAIKKARFLEAHTGETFNGVISAVTRFGVFVLLRQFEVDGLVHRDNLSAIPHEQWEYDEQNFRLVETRSGKSYRLGDELEVVVSACHIADGKIDFTLAKHSNLAKSKDDKYDLASKPPHFDPEKKLREAIKKRGEVAKPHLNFKKNNSTKKNQKKR